MDSNNLNNIQQTNSYYNNGAPNIFQQFALSFVPPQYGRLARVKTGSMIGFVMLLALIATIIEFMSFSFKFSALVNSEQVKDAISNFSLKNGELSLGKEYIIDEEDVFIYLTDEVDIFSYDDAEYLRDMGYTNILLVGKKNFAFVQNDQYQSVFWRNLTDAAIDKEWIEETLIPFAWVFICVGYVFFYVGRTLWYFLSAAIYLLIALIVVSAMNKKVSAAALYRTAVYSKVFMFVIALLASFIPYASMFIPGILRIIATIVFMGFAIAKLPDNC